MKRGTEYDLHYYSHRQFWRLVRDLSAFGWRVEIIIAPDRRRPDRPLAPNHCLVRVSNDGYGTGEDRHAEGGERAGDTPWEALSRAVEDIVNPLEAGTANNEALTWDTSIHYLTCQQAGDCRNCRRNREPPLPK